MRLRRDKYNGREGEGWFEPLTFEDLSRLDETMPAFELWFNDGSTMKRIRTNGRVRKWKTKPDYLEIPLKYGFRTYLRGMYSLTNERLIVRQGPELYREVFVTETT